MNRRRIPQADSRMRRRRPRKLGLENLEPRSLLSGGLTVTASDVSVTARVAFRTGIGSITDTDPNAMFVGATINWGDGSSDSVEEGPGTNVPVIDGHTYESPGTYTVTLSAYDSDGNSSTSTATATVGTPPGWGLSLSASNVSATARESSTLTLGTVSDPWSSFVGISINWGDGSSDSVEEGPGTNVPITDSHTYESPGTYTVSLSAYDSDGNNATATATATVATPPGWGLSLSASNVSATARESS
ncbi:MAG: PKD domain-containing protein, partial [Isosphaeraceae bacterium]|nr:PKD domain-containing protein [Isosphaeraceae bacterium]